MEGMLLLLLCWSFSQRLGLFGFCGGKDMLKDKMLELLVFVDSIGVKKIRYYLVKSEEDYVAGKLFPSVEKNLPAKSKASTSSCIDATVHPSSMFMFSR